MKKIVYPILILTLFCIVLFSIIGEKVAYNDGAGWDGLFYRNVTYDFSTKIISQGYDSYRIQRILPFGIINIVFNAVNIEKNNANLMNAIQLFNLFILILGVVFFFKICKELRLSLPVIIIGFSTLFFNYPILKLMGYYPFLTDTYALVLAIIQFYFFIKNKKILLVLISVIGAFTWPTLFLCGLVLAFFPATKFTINEELSALNSLILSIIKAMMIIGLPLLFICGLILKPDFVLWYSGEKFSSYYMLGLSLISIAIYIYFIIKPIKISIIGNLSCFARKFPPKNIFSFLLIYSIIKLIIHFISNGTSFASLPTMLIGRLLMPPAVDPFVFLICNFMYFGFIIFFLMFFWKNLLQEYSQYGYSFFIVIALACVMSLNTESRHLLSFIPFLLFPLLQFLTNINHKKITVAFSMVFSLGSLFLSRFWYKINVPGIEKAFLDPVDNKIGSYQDFPAQRYFMAHGPWMSHEMYYTFSCLFILCLIVFMVYFNSEKYIKIINQIVIKKK